jgi:hypothetical protein
MSRVDSKTFKAEQVLHAEAIFAVFLDNQPINLRSVDTTLLKLGPKYKKCSFSNAGHAYNLAEKLSKLFRCDRFKVVKLISGTTIDESE